MTKAEATVIMAFTGVRTLKDEDLPMFYAYVEAVTGIQITLDEIQSYETDDEMVSKLKGEVRHIISEASRSDFETICSHLNYGYVFQDGKAKMRRVTKPEDKEE